MLIMRSVLREVLHLAIDGLLYRPATADETASELARWEMTR